MANLYDGNVGAYTPDTLFYDTKHPVDTKAVTLKSGQGVLLRGTVLGTITTGGLSVIVNSANADGSQTADSILTDDVDTTGGNVVAVAYKTGSFNRKALIFGGSDTADKHEQTLRGLGIFMKDKFPY